MRSSSILSSSPPRPLLLALTFVLVGLNLRPPMAAIGPLLTPIKASIPLSYTLISLLTMLPVLAMGLAMFGGAHLAARIGVHRAIALSLVVIGCANLARLYADSALDLILTAVIAGGGIAIIQAAMPGIIKTHFRKSFALLMGVYVTSIMAGAAISAAASPFIAAYAGDWRIALSCWSALAIFALAAWFYIRPQLNAPQEEQGYDMPRERFFRKPRAWLIGTFFGLSTASFTCILAWLPPYYVDLGWADTHAGLLLGYLSGMEVLSGLLLPALASRRADRRPILIFALVLVMFGYSGLILAPLAAPVLWIGLLGCGVGGLFPLSMIIAMDHIDSPQRAGQLTAFVQGVGYFIAAMSPLLAGLIKDISSSFLYAWVVLMGCTVLMFFMAWRFDPTHTHQHFQQHAGSAS